MKMTMYDEYNLLNLYATRNEIAAKAKREFELGFGDLYPDYLRKFDEQLEQIEKRSPKVPFASMEKWNDPVIKATETSVDAGKTPPKYWITKDDNGDYYYKSKKVDIKNKDAKYMKIFNLVFSQAPLGGSVSYKKLEELGRQQTPKLSISNGIVQRALTGSDANFFKYVKGIPQTPDDKPLFSASKTGKEIEFKNQH